MPETTWVLMKRSLLAIITTRHAVELPGMNRDSKILAVTDFSTVVLKRRERGADTVM